MVDKEGAFRVKYSHMNKGTEKEGGEAVAKSRQTSERRYDQVKWL